MARPISPPKASISRTKWPLAVPPMAGLQGISATVSGDSVTRPTRQPIRAAAQAASQPAWPAPMMTTSNSCGSIVDPLGPSILLADAEPREDVQKQIVRRTAPGHLFEVLPRACQVHKDEFLRRARDQREYGALDRVTRIFGKSQMPNVRDGGRFAEHVALEQGRSDLLAEFAKALTRHRRNRLGLLVVRTQFVD